MGPYYYGFGSQLLNFDNPENPEIAQCILQTFINRFRRIMDSSQNAYNEDTSSLVARLDELERALFQAGQKGLNDFQCWEKGQASQITVSSLVQNYDAAHPHRDSRLAGRQGLHLESVICVPGGCAEPLVNSIVPFSSPPLLSLLPNLTVRLAHLVLLQGRVNGVVGVLSSLLVSPALLKVCSSPGAQHIVFISVPTGQFIIHIVLAQQQLWFRGLAKLSFHKKGRDDDCVNEEESIK